MDKPTESITRARAGYWNSQPVHAATNPGGMDVSDDGLTRGHVTNFPEAVSAVGNMAQWTGEQAEAAEVSVASVAERLIATSASMLVIGSGTKVFAVTEPGRSFAVGQRIVATSGAAWMFGTVSAWADDELSVAVAAGDHAGAGSTAGWTIALSGLRGPDGPQGDPGDDGTDGINGDGPVWYGTSTGTANAQVLAGPLGALTGHPSVEWIAGFSNTGPMTLAVGATAATSQRGADGSALVGGEVVAGTKYVSTYDGAYWRLAGGAGSGAGRSAALLRPAVINGAGVTYLQQSNGIVYEAALFDASSSRYAQALIRWPGGGSTFTFSILWSGASGAGGVVWGAQAVAVGDGEAIDAAFGAAVTVTDTTAAGWTLQVSDASGAVTVAGTPSVGELVAVQLYRDAPAGADTLADTAFLLRARLTLPDGSVVELEPAGREADTLHVPRYLEMVAMAGSFVALDGGGVVSCTEIRGYESTDGSTANVFLAGTTSASQVLGGAASLANDSNTGTRWSTGNPSATGQWWRIDLGANNIKVIRRWEIVAADPYGGGNAAIFTAGKIRASMDALSWTDVATISPANTLSAQGFVLPLTLI